MKRTAPVFDLTADDIFKAVSSLKEIIPQREALCAECSRRKIAAMEVRTAPKADFITPDMDSFLRFLKINSIRTAMYHYDYYDDRQLELCFKLPEANINLFERHPSDGYNYGGRHGAEISDYTYYLRYSEFLRQNINTGLPHTLWLFTLYQGMNIACKIADDWIRRTGLPTVQTIMLAAANCRKYGTYDQGIIRFRFTNPAAGKHDTPLPPHDTETAPPSSPAVPKTAPEVRPDPDSAYQRILKNIEKGRMYK